MNRTNLTIFDISYISFTYLCTTLVLVFSCTGISNSLTTFSVLQSWKKNYKTIDQIYFLNKNTNRRVFDKNKEGKRGRRRRIWGFTLQCLKLEPICAHFQWKLQRFCWAKIEKMIAQKHHCFRQSYYWLHSRSDLSEQID